MAQVPLFMMAWYWFSPSCAWHSWLAAALLLAIEVARAEVPAAWPLHDVSAQRGHVAHLRRGGVARGIRERGVVCAGSRDASRDLGERDQRSEVQPIRSRR